MSDVNKKMNELNEDDLESVSGGATLEMDSRKRYTQDSNLVLTSMKGIKTVNLAGSGKATATNKKKKGVAGTVNSAPSMGIENPEIC